MVFKLRPVKEALWIEHLYVCPEELLVPFFLSVM
jgi:hypothetical protein